VLDANRRRPYLCDVSPGRAAGCQSLLRVRALRSARLRALVGGATVPLIRRKDSARGGRLPDPGPWAACAGCGRRRFEHGGPKRLGGCPDQVGIRAGRFKIKPVIDPK
jgi:hypothetical protein